MKPTKKSEFGEVEGTDTEQPDARLAVMGPHMEIDEYGHATGVVYVRCEGCSREVLGGDTTAISHAPDCPRSDHEEAL